VLPHVGADGTLPYVEMRHEIEVNAAETRSKFGSKKVQNTAKMSGEIAMQRRDTETGFFRSNINDL
jgi:hypothetical protein